jgi:hypothetical protein
MATNGTGNRVAVVPTCSNGTRLEGNRHDKFSIVFGDQPAQHLRRHGTFEVHLAGNMRCEIIHFYSNPAASQGLPPTDIEYYVVKIRDGSRLLFERKWVEYFSLEEFPDGRFVLRAVCGNHVQGPFTDWPVETMLFSDREPGTPRIRLTSEPCDTGDTRANAYTMYLLEQQQAMRAAHSTN